MRSTVLGGEILTRLDQAGNKKITYVPAEGLLFATQRADSFGPSVLLTQRNPHGITETTRAVYDPLGNYIPFQQFADPRPPAGSFNSASMSSLSASQANPFSYGVGCLMDGLPTNCNRVAQAVNNGQGSRLIIDARGQNPNVALANMGIFIIQYPLNAGRSNIPPRLKPRRPNPVPGNRDPFNIGKDEGLKWGFALLAQEPRGQSTEEVSVQSENCTFPAFMDLSDRQRKLLDSSGGIDFYAGENGLPAALKASFLNITGTMDAAGIDYSSARLQQGGIHQDRLLFAANTTAGFRASVENAIRNNSFTLAIPSASMHSNMSDFGARQNVSFESLQVGFGPAGAFSDIDRGNPRTFWGFFVHVGELITPGETDPFDVGRSLGTNVTRYTCKRVYTRGTRPLR